MSGGNGQRERKRRPCPTLANGVKTLALRTIKPSPENRELYRPVDPDDAEVKALADSIHERGILEPLVVTEDRWIISGHRRHVAAGLAGLSKVPCKVIPIRRKDDPDAFVRLLREHNRQRTKSRDEALREELVDINPDEAHRELQSYRAEQSKVAVGAMAIHGETRRKRISKAKRPFLDAVLRIFAERKKYWPLSDRRVHYLLLNDPPLTHAKKPNSGYDNDRFSYKKLTDLLTRARLEGDIPMEAIADPTRPVTLWRVHDDVRGYVQGEVEGFFRGYWRDLMQSQSKHVEILAEKNTIEPILQPVAGEYTIPLTSGRGYCSLPPRFEMAERFKKSGKSALALLVVSDFDPEGEDIPHSIARSLRDDFGVCNVQAIKVALTASQVAEHELPRKMVAKKKGSRYERFAEEHGDQTWEVEALEARAGPETLQQMLRDAIDAVIDVDAFNHEVEAEKKDAAWLAGVRRLALEALKGVVDV